jgi:hypothetical protein
MPAPTALKNDPEPTVESVSTEQSGLFYSEEYKKAGWFANGLHFGSGDNDLVLIDVSVPSLETTGVNPSADQKDVVMEVMQVNEEGRPIFAPAKMMVGLC